MKTEKRKRTDINENATFYNFFEKYVKTGAISSTQKQKAFKKLKRKEVEYSEGSGNEKRRKRKFENGKNGNEIAKTEKNGKKILNS